MNKLTISALLIGTLLSANAFADHRDHWRDEHRDYKRHNHTERVIVKQVYTPPRVVYVQPQPRTVYRERVVYREVPVQYQEVYGYDERYYDNRVNVNVRNTQASDQFAGQVVGAVAGGLIGNQIGKGNGRVAATALGAVVGAVVGGELAR